LYCRLAILYDKGLQFLYSEKGLENLAMNSRPERQIPVKIEESTEAEKELAVETPSLNTLFPKDERDLDALFPEPEVRQLFVDVAANLKRVGRFVSRMEQDLPSNQGSKKIDHCKVKLLRKGARV
jgi:hypothetical protein